MTTLLSDYITRDQLAEELKVTKRTLDKWAFLRSGPKKNAAAISTVPAKTSVQVMGCQKWCQIVYNGKTGWIYKSYIKTGA